MINQKLCKYCQEIFDIELFLYQQNKIKETINNQINKLHNIPYELYYNEEPSEYPDYFVKTKKTLSITFFCLYTFLFFLFARSSGVQFGKFCLHSSGEGFQYGFGFLGAWWNVLPKPIAFIVGLLLVFIFLILGLLFRFWPVSVLLVGIPICYGLSPLIPWLLFKKLTNQKKEKYRRRYEEDANAKNDIIEQRNQALKNEYNQRIDNLKKELLFVDKTIQKSQVVLNKYYNQGIIYKDYQNIFAMGCIVEYLKSGICNRLEGPHGAYKTYRDEYFKRKEIALLEQHSEYLLKILNRVEEIAENQHELIAAISSVNTRVDNLDYQISNTNMALDTITKNTEIAAYNSDVIKRVGIFGTCLSVYNTLAINEIREEM